MRKLEYWKYCLIIVSLVLVSIQIQAQNGWTLKTTIPTLRVGASAEIINGKIYVMGGVTTNFLLSAVNEMYDPLRITWDTLAPMATPRAFFASAIVNDTIYAIGGGYSGPIDKVEAYDPVTDTWLPKANLLNPRFCMRGAAVDGIIYIVGGNYNEHNCQVYDPDSNKWTEKSPMPSDGGGNLSLTVYDGLIYTFGGSSNSSYNEPWEALSTVYEYNPQTDIWTKKNDMPSPRFGLGTYLVNGKIYAIGGSQSRNTTLATVEVYDPVTNTWETKPDMPFNSFDFARAVVDNKIYVISGSSDWQTSDGAVWEYDPPVVDVEHEFIPPTKFVLAQNYPNPFNPTTKIKYSVPQASNTTIKVFDVLGNEIETLVNEEKPVGTYELTWNAANLPSGVYFYQLKAGSFIETKKMILLK